MKRPHISIRRFLQCCLCTLLSVAIVVQPIYQTVLWAGLFGVLNSPLMALAQTLPPSAPDGAAAGRELGESLLRGPSSDGSRIYFNGANGTESIDVNSLFQPAGSADDVEQMMEAFGDDPSADVLATEVTARLATEDSQQATAYATFRDSALSHSHPDLGDDPIFNRSREVRRGDNPIFDTFFPGCESVDVPISSGSTVHVEDPRYCSRVITPLEHCEITHEYDAGLVRLVGGEGGVESCGEGCLDVYVGRVGDNYWTGNCSIFEQDVRLQIDNPAAIRSAVLTEARWDDRMQILLNGTRIWQGRDDFPPETAGQCELRSNWTATPNLDLTTHFQQSGILEFLIRVSVYRGGEGYARIRILYNTNEVVTQDRWSISPECDALLDGLNDGACSLASMNCLDGPAMDIPCTMVNGYQVCQGDLSAGPIAGYSPLCRRGEINGNCQFMRGPMECWTDPNGQRQCPENNGDNPNGCAIFEDNPQCAFVSSNCLPFGQGDSGRCYVFEEHWDCGQDVSLPGGNASRVTCDGPIRCMGEDCVSPTRETNPDFARAAGALSAITFMEMDTTCVDGNPDNCTIFAGEAMECKQALGGYQDCCNVPVSVGLADYLKLTLASYDVAKKLQLGAKLVDAGLNYPGAWNAVRNWATSTSTYETVAKWFTSAWDYLGQGYGGVATEAIESFSLDALQAELTASIGNFVGDVFGPEVAEMFFGGATDAAGEFAADGTLTQGLTSVLNVIAWVYAIYVIINIIIDIVWACEEEEFMLAARRQMLACTHIGRYCYDDTAFGCIETRDAYCCYSSPLARIVMQGAIQQMGIDVGQPETPNCQGLTIAQVAALDWNQIDLDQWYGILAANNVLPNDAPSFENRYALENVTRYQIAPGRPNAPERIQNEVEAAQYFDEARARIREDLWNGAD